MRLRPVLTFVLLAALAAGGTWLWRATEWHESTEPLRPQGEAASNRWYTLQRLAEQAGSRTVVRDQVEPLPPTDATLVLLSHHWNLFPGRAQALRRWVEQGGQLVLTQHLLPSDQWRADLERAHEHEDDPRGAPAGPPDEDATRPDGPADSRASEPAAGRATGEPEDGARPDAESTLAWVPVVRRHDAADAKAAAAVVGKRPRDAWAPACRPYTEALGKPYGAARRYRVCAHSGDYLVPRAPVLWSVNGPAGPALLSVAVGRGRVTVLPHPDPFHNRRLLDGDHALVAAAALPLRPGQVLWLVGDESRTPLLAWVWQRGWVAVLLAALLIALWLARRMPRFGPLRAAPPSARRAVTEQVRGTAAFLVAHGAGAALLAAQRRALAEAAERRITGFTTLGEAARAAALAARTGLPAARLAAAWQGTGSEHHSRLIAALQLLETARRRLAADEPPPSPYPVTKAASDAHQP